ncbi:hypothetical protein CY35_03G080000 [Sphagnum magellanicum]|nr:hypothetical protein CY35_03G080000 [Sphagnum magellanicum]
MGRNLKWSQPEPFQKLPGGHPKPVRTAAVLLLMILFPPFIIFIWYTMIHLEGSAERSYRFFQARGIRGLRDVWPQPTILACKIIGVFVTFEAVLLIFLPAERYIGPLSPAGNRPIYKKNGFVAYMVTLAVYYFLWKEHLFNPGLVYDNIGEIFSVLVIASYAGALLLYCKGHMAPSSEDWGSSGNILGDLFWGMELYPRITSHFDIKVFLNCRFAVMTWAMLVISFAIKQCDTQGKITDSMLVTSILMMIYITKFFWTEPQFFRSIEIAHDRAGFLFLWTSLVWIPVIHSLVNLYLVSHPIQLGRGPALGMFGAGLACNYIIYDCNVQRLLFINSNGKCRIWGKIPSKIQLHYVTEWGERKHSLLLTAGWWSVARHFHLAPEIGLAICWQCLTFMHFS